MYQQKEDENVLSLKDAWFVFWNNRYKILILTICGSLIGILIMMLAQLQSNVSPRTMISASIAVISENNRGTFSGGATPNSSEVKLAEDMATSVIYVATSNQVMQRVIAELELFNVSTRELQQAFSVRQHNNSQIIEIRLVWPYETEGVRILEKMVEILPDVLISTLKIGGVTVVDYPETSVYIPAAEKKNIIIGAAVGLLLGIGYCVYIMLIRPSFYSSDTIENQLGLQILADIPFDKQVKALPKGELLARGNKVLGGNFVESFSRLSYILCHKLKNEENNAVFVTSVNAKEGKTLTVANLAWQLASHKKKVLMIDFDIRNPSLSQYFIKDFDEKKTLNAISRENIPVKEAITSLNPYLDILPSFLESKRANISDFAIDAIKEIMHEYDVVLIDTSPFGLVADALHINELSNYALFVIRQGGVWQELVALCLENLSKSGTKVIGGIFNAVDTKTPATRYYYKYNGYSYYHATEKTEEESMNAH